MQWISHNTHLVFLIAKYIILLTLGWFVDGVVGGGLFVVIGLVLFVLFDIAAATLWFVIRPEKKVVTLWMVASFYIVQVMAISTLLICVFSPGLIAALAQQVMDSVF